MNLAFISSIRLNFLKTSNYIYPITFTIQEKALNQFENNQDENKHERILSAQLHIFYNNDYFISPSRIKVIINK